MGSTEPLVCHSLSEVCERSGFVFTPFTQSAQQPLLLFTPVTVSNHACDYFYSRLRTKIATPMNSSALCEGAHDTACEAVSNDYSRSFDIVKQWLAEKKVGKVVLARYKDITLKDKPDLERLFHSACQMYPRMFVALISAKACGTWLMATPETLLSSDANGNCQTMALAGTMRLDDCQTGFDDPLGKGLSTKIAWSHKNRQEQKIVADYIRERLAPIARGIIESEPYTSRAGNLVHLRSDFSFRIAKSNLSAVIETLFPTPAVCGMPKAEAKACISASESFNREYYSGFAGPLNMSVGDNEQASSNLFVSLRCMKITDQKLRLFAGGGILPDSDKRSEWLETEAKMNTILQIVG